MTHKEQAARRKSMAEAVRGGRDIQEVAAEYNVSHGQVRVACHEHGVPRPHREIVRAASGDSRHAGTWKILGRLRAGVAVPVIGRELNVCPNTVYAVVVKVRELDLFPLPQVQRYEARSK